MFLCFLFIVNIFLSTFSGIVITYTIMSIAFFTLIWVMCTYTTMIIWHTVIHSKSNTLTYRKQEIYWMKDIIFNYFFMINRFTFISYITYAFMSLFWLTIIWHFTWTIMIIYITVFGFWTYTIVFIWLSFLFFFFLFSIYGYFTLHIINITITYMIIGFTLTWTHYFTNT